MELGIATLLYVALYFLPSIIVQMRRHHQGTAIFVLNLLLGWTVLGWIAALVWSLTAVQQPQREGPERKYWLPPSDDPRSPPHA